MYSAAVTCTTWPTVMQSCEIKQGLDIIEAVTAMQGRLCGVTKCRSGQASCARLLNHGSAEAVRGTEVRVVEALLHTCQEDP